MSPLPTTVALLIRDLANGVNIQEPLEALVQQELDKAFEEGRKVARRELLGERRDPVEGALPGTVARPGDVVVLVVQDPLSEGLLEHMRDSLRELAPEVRWVITQGSAAVVVRTDDIALAEDEGDS